VCCCCAQSRQTNYLSLASSEPGFLNFNRLFTSLIK
jgi:hypothetical protein